jgi:hypothetical protein
VFSGFGHFTHQLHGGDRVCADRCLLAQHEGIGAIEHSICDVGDFRPGRHRRPGHGFKHLRGSDHGRPHLVAPADDPLLQHGHLGQAHLDSKIPSGDHHDRRHVNDLIEVVDRRSRFDLGDEERFRPALGQCPLSSSNIVGVADERQADEVDFCVDRNFKGSPIRWGECLYLGFGTRQVHPFAGLQPTRPDDLCEDIATVDADHLGDDASVSQHDGVARVNDLAQIVERRRDLLRGAENGVGGQNYLVSSLEAYFFGAEESRPDLRTGQVGEDADRGSCRPAGVADPPNSLGLFVMRAVRKVHSKDVHSRLGELRDRARVIGSRSDGCNDLRVSAHRMDCMEGGGADRQRGQSKPVTLSNINILFATGSTGVTTCAISC